MAGAFNRLASLYATVERIRSVELRCALAEFEEVQRMAELQRAISADQTTRSRAALASGNRVEWLLAQTSCEFAETRIMHLEAVQLARMQAVDEASAAHRESNVSAQQMERLLAQVGEAKKRQQEREDQAAADDRYASRMGSTRPTRVR